MNSKFSLKFASFIHKVPNWLTYLRLLLIPVFVFLFNDPSQFMVYLSAIIFVFASFTDYLDGMIARKYGAVSNTGKLLDPLADKILIMAALIMLVAQRSDSDGSPWVPAWMVVLILAREIWVTGLRGIAATQGVTVAASNTGKYKTVAQVVAVTLLILHGPIQLFGYSMTFKWIGMNILFLSLAFSYWSAIEYTYEILALESEKST